MPAKRWVQPLYGISAKFPQEICPSAQGRDEIKAISQ